MAAEPRALPRSESRMRGEAVALERESSRPHMQEGYRVRSQSSRDWYGIKTKAAVDKNSCLSWSMAGGPVGDRRRVTLGVSPRPPKTQNHRVADLQKREEVIRTEVQH